MFYYVIIYFSICFLGIDFVFMYIVYWRNLKDYLLGFLINVYLGKFRKRVDFVILICLFF